MTLVIGHAGDDIGFLVADTLISYPSGTAYNPREPALDRFHGLKIQILSPVVAVALAGDVENAMVSIRTLREEILSSGVASIADRLAELRRKNALLGKPCPDFLVLWVADDGSKRLARVCDSGISFCQRAYIGDSVEYQNFRRLCMDYNGPRSRNVQQKDGSIQDVIVTEGEKEFDQVSDAMERLTHQRRSMTVGAICGCVVRVVDARISGKLEYLQSVESSISIEEGEAGFSLLAANAKEPRGIGLYFRRWHAGLLFIVGDSTPCRREQAPTIRDFVALAHKKYGMNLDGGFW